MKRILSLTLAILMLALTCAGCAKETDPLIGTWKGQVNYADYFNQLLPEAFGENLAEYWSVDQFTLTIIMTFREDGTYSQTVDPDTLNASLEQLKSALSAGMKEFIQDLIDASGEEMTSEELMAQLGINVDDLLGEALSEEVINALVAECTFEGNFDAKDGKLYTSAGLEYSIDESIYETYEISGDTLKLLSIVSGENTSRLDAALYPITLTRS